MMHKGQNFIAKSRAAQLWGAIGMASFVSNPSLCSFLYQRTGFSGLHKGLIQSVDRLTSNDCRSQN